MSSASNVPAIEFLPTGVSVPDAAAVLAGAQQDINAAFNGNLNFTKPNTPQAQLAAANAAIISNAYALIAYFVNNVNPRSASAFMQDAIGALYFLTRIAGTPTSVACTCTGLPGTTIAQGSLAQDASGNLYESTAAVTIGGGGSASVQFENQLNGPIGCPAGTLTTIYQSVPGWDSISNPSDGITGTNVESTAAFAFRIQQSVAANAQGTGPAIYAAVFQVPGVTDVYYTENNTAATVTRGSTAYSMAPYSIYVGVVGGDPLAVATAIWNKKAPGCLMLGNTTETVTDKSSGYAYPFPTYTVKFNIPAATTVKFAVSIKSDANLPSNITQLIQNAIIAQFTGQLPALQRARVGALLVANDYVDQISGTAANVKVLSVQVGFSTANQTNVQMGIDEAPVTAAGNIAVTLV